MGNVIYTDVLVIGSGIAGITSSINASKNGSKVLMISSRDIFSGSSFYPGTWGLGLIGPEDESDIESLIESILKRGKGVALDFLVRTFIENLNPSIDEFEKLGIKLKKPDKGKEKEIEYIPCFDNKIRRWRGLTKENLKNSMMDIFNSYKIKTMPFCQAVDLIKKDNKILGATAIKDKKSLVQIRAKATILASGGLSGLYKNYLTTSDVEGIGLGMALKSGAKAINLEFSQIMLAFVYPSPKTIYNEKTFLASEFYNEKKESFIEKYLPDNLSIEEVLDNRRKHGPFSSEGIGKYVDLAILKETSKQKEKYVNLKYNLDKLNINADFIKTYFNWLRREKSITVENKIKIAHYMHASNGGILINEKGESSIEGLYAAGEITGGMHGADRIGGLSTANAIVFGKIAGQNASRYALKSKKNLEELNYFMEEIYIEDADKKLKKLRELMQDYAFLIRREADLNYLLEELPKLLLKRKDKGSIEELLNSKKLYFSVISAMSIVVLQRKRKESRGSHYREDYPENNPKFNHPFILDFVEKNNDFNEKFFRVSKYKNENN